MTDIAEIRAIAGVLSREYALDILQDLHARGPSTASEVARELGMHVATAMRTLADMESASLVARRTREGTSLAEFAPASPRFEIVLDLASQARAAAAEASSRAGRTFVREKPNRKVIAEADEEGRRIVRLVFVRGPRWRSAVETLALSEVEGRFLFHLPFASDRAESVAALCLKAAIRDPLDVARVLEFVEEAERLGVVEVVR